MISEMDPEACFTRDVASAVNQGREQTRDAVNYVLREALVVADELSNLVAG
jgi:hypothetical protein